MYNEDSVIRRYERQLSLSRIFVLYKKIEHIFILNTNALNKTNQKKLEENILLACNEENIQKEIYYTKQKKDVDCYIREALQRNVLVRFYACGGDGTLNEVANAAKGYRNAEIAVIPLGTGNDFIKSFTNYKYFLDIERQIKGKSIPIDTISFDNRLAVNMVNIGFDSAVVEKTEQTKKIPLITGSMAYLIGVAVVLKDMPLFDLEMIIDNEEKINGKFLLSAIANGSYCGGGFNALSKAVVNDGYIDMIMVKPLKRREFLAMVGKYKKGTLLETALADRILYYRRCKSVKFIPVNSFNICVDGEMYLTNGTEFNIQQQSILFSVPLGSEMKNK
jgi:YegS/Rv2252/BmrU family lipid kinase